MSVYTQAELAYLRGERRLAHVATVGRDGTPHVTPVGTWSVDPETGTVEVTGHGFAATKKFRDVARSGHAAIVVDDVLPPWQPRGVEIRGRAEAVDGPGHTSASAPPASSAGAWTTPAAPATPERSRRGPTR